MWNYFFFYYILTKTYIHQSLLYTSPDFNFQKKTWLIFRLREKNVIGFYAAIFYLTSISRDFCKANLITHQWYCSSESMLIASSYQSIIPVSVCLSISSNGSLFLQSELFNEPGQRMYVLEWKTRDCNTGPQEYNHKIIAKVLLLQPQDGNRCLQSCEHNLQLLLTKETQSRTEQKWVWLEQREPWARTPPI